MSDPVRVLLLAAVLSGVAVSSLAWSVSRFDPASPERLVGELRLARWAAILLAAVGAISIGLALDDRGFTGNTDIALAVMFVGTAGLVLQREPREGLFLAALAFIAHALVNLAHRPGWLSSEVVPHWYAVGCAVYDSYLAALCYWTRRR